MMATKTKIKEPATTPSFDITVPLQELINELQAKVGDGGTVEDRQRTIDGLQSLIGLNQATQE